jgi:tetratricopeptide (TPR) repeat protein
MPSNRLAPAAGRGSRAFVAGGNQALYRFAAVAPITMFLTVFLAPSAQAEALAEPYRACLEMGSVRQIESCTAAIQSGKWSGKALAWAYNNRGLAYFSAGDLDRAFADDSEAIRLDPNDAPAFNNRGMVYMQRDDLDHAIADFSETIRLDPNYVIRLKATSTTPLPISSRRRG